MSDTARTVLSDPRAPADELHDANAEMHKAVRPTQSDLIPAAHLAPIINMIRDGLEDGDTMAKAQGRAMQLLPTEHSARAPGERGMRSVYLDELQIFVSGDYFDKPSPLGFEGLRQMVEQTPVLNAVVMTRLRQVSQFTQISEDGGKGFEICHIDRKHKLTPEETTTTKLLARFVANCGWEFNPRKRKAMGRSSFTQYVQKSLRDSLTMDAAPTEVEMKRDRSLGIDGFYAVDGSTVRLCTEKGYAGDDSVTALQVIQGRVCTAYTNDSLIYEVRNPRTDVRLAGYGLGEPEILVRCVTGFLNAMSYNSAGFDNNSIPKGILQLTGDYGADDLASFRRYWNQSVKGINNAWTLPVMVAKNPDSKVSFEKFGMDFNEMAFAKWMTFLTSLITAIYGMAPEEINFESFAAQKSSMAGSDTEEKLTSSKDLGLHSLMAHKEAELTDYIIAEFDPKYCLRWRGLNPEDEARKWEAKKLILTLDEMRAEEGYGSFKDDKLGAAPMNPSLIGPWMQLNAAPAPGADFGGQQGEGAPDHGDPDAAGPDDEGDDLQDGSTDDGSGQPPPAGPPGAGAGEGAAPPAAGKDFGGGAGAGGAFGKALTIYSVGE